MVVRGLCAALLSLGALLPAAAPAEAAAPPNDSFADAQALPSQASLSVPGTTVGSTTESGEPKYSSFLGVEGLGSVWYSWKAPYSSRFGVNLCTEDKTRLVIYRGTSFSSLQRPFSDDDRIKNPLQCLAGQDQGDSFYFDAKGGTTYRIAVVDDAFDIGGEVIGEGPFQLAIGDRPVQVFDGGVTEIASKSRVRRGGILTYTATLRNNGDTADEHFYLEMVASRPHRLSQDAQKVSYLSFSSSRGSCHRQQFFSVHKGILCSVGRLGPGQRAVIKARVRLRQSITNWAFLDYAPGVGEPIFDDNRKNDESKRTTLISR